MRIIKLTALLTVLLPLAVAAQEAKVFRWVDENGVVHFGDSIPAKYAELPKQVLNEHGVAVEELEGKKTPEQIEAERIEKERLMAIELRKRADQALLATYLTVEEIMMHRDRRVELFQAQSKVTELYLSNLSRRMENLRQDAARYSPYSEDPDAAIIPEDLANDLRVTKDTIARHERNLKKFLDDEKRIISRFAGDITRFKELKGIE